MLPSLAMGIYLGFSSGMWQLAFMSMASATIALVIAKRQRKTPEDIRITLNRRTLRLHADGRAISRLTWLLRPSIRKASLSHLEALRSQRSSAESLKRLMQTLAEPPPGSKVSMFCGVAGSTAFEVEIADAPHVFVVGPTGCGKSRLMILMAQSLAARYPMERLQLAIVDYKGGALIRDSGLENRLAWRASDLEPGGWWLLLEEQLRARERLLEQAGCSHFAETGLPVLVVFVDELGEAVKSTEAARCLSAVGARGRSLGISLVVANQGLAGVPRELLLNLRLRLALAGIDPVELVQLGSKAAPLVQQHPRLAKGRAIRQGVADRDFEFPFGGFD